MLLLKMLGLLVAAFAIGWIFENYVDWKWSNEMIVMGAVVGISCVFTGLLNPKNLLAMA